jgi:hypothetical protein
VPALGVRAPFGRLHLLCRAASSGKRLILKEHGKSMNPLPIHPGNVSENEAFVNKQSHRRK